MNDLRRLLCRPALIFRDIFVRVRTENALSACSSRIRFTKINNNRAYLKNHRTYSRSLRRPGRDILRNSSRTRSYPNRALLTTTKYIPGERRTSEKKVRAGEPVDDKFMAKNQLGSEYSRARVLRRVLLLRRKRRLLKFRFWSNDQRGNVRRTFFDASVILSDFSRSFRGRLFAIRSPRVNGHETEGQNGPRLYVTKIVRRR